MNTTDRSRPPSLAEIGTLSLGMDIGSVNARAALVDAAGHVLLLLVERIQQGPTAAVTALLDRILRIVPLKCIVSAGVCGSGRHLFDGRLGWQVFSSPYAAMTGVLKDAPDVRTIVQIGGQSSYVIGLEGGADKPWRVARSALCAAGTGRFLEQQASRLGIAMDDFGPRALQWQEAPPRVAARCSVFAKSDLIHLQQKGYPIEAMLAALCDSVARTVKAQWREAFTPPVLFVGGVAANSGVLRALSLVLGENISAPIDPADQEAIGAALLASGSGERAWTQEDLYPSTGSEPGLFVVERRLNATTDQNGWHPAELSAERPTDVYLGVDVGSTSTKAAVVNGEGTVLAKSYLMTAGQPLEAIKQVMAELAPMVEGKVHVRGAGVTGSGRYLVGHFIGADLIKNEITSQTRAALQIDPGVDTIFELGGQDAKYVYLENGTALDYRMNKACAAGTGSFLDELSEQLGISTRSGEFAQRAFDADYQVDLGERCAAFMSQAVTSAQHAHIPLDVIVSSLSTSLAKNYRSKVVGTGRVGQRVFLTGAVFYNQAAVAAYKAEFPGKEFIIPEHKEVTGAIGAALLARESMVNGNESAFKGFTNVAQAEYKLANFTCAHCENNCAISMMRTASGPPLYYGSRCDRYDAQGAVADGPTHLHTPFTERESLLFGDADDSVADKESDRLVVGVPRALMTYDLAPLLGGFLEALGVTVRYSPPSTKAIIERAVELGHTDTCFPIKLLHGHIDHLLAQGVDRVLVPNAIRLDRMGGDADQRYACPLVQAAPYIVRSVFDLGERILDPIIDLSQGDDAVIADFGRIAQQLGFKAQAGRVAGRAALRRQRAFENQLHIAGKRLLDALAANPNQTGIVLLSRAYMAQDHGANLGVAEALQRMGVVPIPLDYLPLDDVDIEEISDRPYWQYERKLLAASKLVAENEQLFGLFLSNFGCGPNSVIGNIIEDIMGGKPLGQIEIDEHAAEAGCITRLEALVDTVQNYRRSGLRNVGSLKQYSRRVSTRVQSGKTLLLPRMDDHAEALAAAARSFGVDARVLPPSDERSMALSRDVTSGKECLPFRDTLGVFLRMAEDGELPLGARAVMAGSFGPCRLGKYAQEQQKILDEQGIDLTIMSTVSNNAYSDLGLGQGFELLAWQGLVATDRLEKLLWMVRPYEQVKGEADRLYAQYLAHLCDALENHQSIEPLMREAAAKFVALRDPDLPQRPLIGINGEIYLRANRFCNMNLVALCEANGLEAEVSPLSEWFAYTAWRNLEDGWIQRDVGRMVRGGLRKLVMDGYERRVAKWVHVALPEHEPGPRQLLAASAPYLPSRNGSEAVLSMGSGVLQLASPRYAGVISVMPHGCMPGGIVAAFSEQISRQYGHKPWISLTYDGFNDQVNAERVADLAEQVRQRY